MAALMVTLTAAAAAEDAKYPDWKGQWLRQRVPGVARRAERHFADSKSYRVRQRGVYFWHRSAPAREPHHIPRKGPRSVTREGWHV